MSSTFRDMHAERDWLVLRTFPQIEERLRSRRLHLEAVDLRLGVEPGELGNEEARELLVLKVCLEEIKRSRPFLIVLLGDRYGWVPPPERMTAAVHEHGFDKSLTGCSVTALEVEFGLLKSHPQQKQRTLFFFRRSLPYAEMPTEFAARYSDEFSPDPTISAGYARLQALKERIRRDPELGPRVFDYSVSWDTAANQIRGLEEFGELVYRELWAALDDETKHLDSAPLSSWPEQERASLDDFVERHDRGFVGRTELVSRLVAIACECPPAPTAVSGACVLGPSGSGKSALFARIHRQCISRHGVLLLSNAAGGTARGSRVDAMLRRWIVELSDFLREPNPMAEKATMDEVHATFHALLGRASVVCRVVLLLDALDQTEPTSRGRHLTWLTAAPLPANVRLVATAIPCDASATLAKIPGVELHELSPLSSADASLVATQVWRQHHRALNLDVLRVLTEKRTSAGALASGNPLWLVLASEQLNLLDADDFLRAEDNYTGPPKERTQALILDTARQMPAELSALYIWLFRRADKSFGPYTRAFVAALALSRHGWRDSDLQALIPRLSPLLEDGFQVAVKNLVRQAVAAHTEGWPQPDTPSPPKVLPAATLAVLRRAFRHSLILRDELQWDFFHSEARAAAGVYLGLDHDREEMAHEIIAAFLIEQRNDDPVRCDELTFHLLRAREFGWMQIFYGSTHATHERELASTTSTLVDEVNTGGIERLLKIANIDVLPVIVDGDGQSVNQPSHRWSSFQKDIRRDVAKGWCQRCLEKLMPALESNTSVSQRRQFVALMLSRLADAAKDFPGDAALRLTTGQAWLMAADLARAQGDWNRAKTCVEEALRTYGDSN